MAKLTIFSSVRGEGKRKTVDAFRFFLFQAIEDIRLRGTFPCWPKESFSYFASLMPKITLLGIWGKYFPPPLFQETAPSTKDRAREIAINFCQSAPGRCLLCLRGPCRVRKWPHGRACLTEPGSLSLRQPRCHPGERRGQGESRGSREVESRGVCILNSVPVI